MREFDPSCLTPIEAFEPDAIRAVREDARLSQAVFACALNISVKLLDRWERGESRPGGAGLKLLSLVRHKGAETIL